MTPSLVTRLCYDYHWRDKHLVTIVAIIGAESNYNPDFGDGEKFGLFGLRADDVHTLQNLKDPEYSAKVAREKYEIKFFAPWMSYATGYYYNYIEQSIDGVTQFYLSLFKNELGK